MEVKPLTLDGTLPYLGIKEIGPRWCTGKTPLSCREFPRGQAGPRGGGGGGGGEVTETLCAAGTEDLVRTGCRCFPRVRRTSGESAFWDRPLFPGRVLLCILDNCIMITRLKCQLSGDVLHLCVCDYIVS